MLFSGTVFLLLFLPLLLLIYFLADDDYKMWEKDFETEYTGEIDGNTCRILEISDYDAPPYNQGDRSDLEVPVTILVETENGDRVAIFIEREFIH